jgi:sugar lactone lactonase YvrE
MNRLIAFASLSFVAACTPCPVPAPPGCSTDGTGTIVVTSTGLPSGVTGNIHLTGPTAQTVTSSRTLSVGAGAWSVTADRATAPDPLVRTVYLPTVNPSSFCLSSGGTQDVIVTWAPVATSNKLWVTNANATGQFLGFRSASLSTSATVTPDVVSRGGFGADIAFDRDGNVWVPGGTTADAALQRFPAARFASSAAVEPDLEVSLPGSGCVPLVAGLAFDAAGNLYVSSPCRGAVLRVDAASLAASGVATVSLTIAVPDPGGIAFDRSGNLWVASKMDNRVWRYDASQLAAGAASAPALKLGGFASNDPLNTALLAPSWLAFDARGDLWANDFGGNIFFRVRAASLRGSGTTDVQPEVRITLGVLALLEGFAFDGEGGLWSAGAGGTVVRLAPGQLDVSSGAGMPTMPSVILTSTDIGSAANLAFYPAPAGLPLFHALP